MRELTGRTSRGTSETPPPLLHHTTLNTRAPLDRRTGKTTPQTDSGFGQRDRERDRETERERESGSMQILVSMRAAERGGCFFSSAEPPFLWI